MSELKTHFIRTTKLVSQYQQFQGVVLLDQNGESNDGEDVEEGVGASGLGGNRINWIGAEVKTGKSSIRSIKKTNKVSHINSNIGFTCQKLKRWPCSAAVHYLSAIYLFTKI